ncbi:MAG: FtsX-like permease family protein [Luteitalea sp.]|nr:FtsX-like permease family protein [Luteitalea sp.]
MSWLSRLANVFRTSKVERDLDDELRFHIEARIDQGVAEGLTRQAAEQEVMRQFGGQLRLREQSRDVKLLPWLDSLVKDLRFGARMLRKDAVVTGAAVISLALAIGACTAAFSLIDALILRPLPVRAPERLIYLAFPTYDPAWPEGDTFSYPFFERFREKARAQADLFAMLQARRTRPVVFPDAGGQIENVRTQFLSGDAFDILGVRPAVGRLIAPFDDVEPGNHPVAVLSHPFWMRRFAGDPPVVGRSFTFDGRPFEIIGVADRTFTGVEPGRLDDLWVPNMMWDVEELVDPDSRWLRILGRLKPGVEAEQVRSILQPTFTSLRRERASFQPDEPRDRVEQFLNARLYVRSAENGPSGLRRELARPLWILAFVVGLVLLIAASNVANLLLARAVAREREMSLRLSIGAGRGRLIQQVLIESALLAIVGCMLGLLFAYVAGPTIVRMLAPAHNPAYLDLRVDWRVLAFLGVTGALTTMLVGLAPALRASAVAPMGVLGAASGRLTTRIEALRPLVATQVGFSLVLLFLAGLLLLSFSKLVNVDLGFRPDGLLLLTVESQDIQLAREDLTVALSGLRVDRLTTEQRSRLPGEVVAKLSRLPSTVAQAHTIGVQLLERVRRVPGVQGASLSAWAMFSGTGAEDGVRLPGRALDALRPSILPVSPGFFETMGIRLLDGRAFEPRDAERETPTVVVVNEAFARRYFGRERAVGRVFDRVNAMVALRQEIVGVIADARHSSVRHPPPPTIYVPLRGFRALQVRAEEPLALMDTLRRAISSVHPSLRVTDVQLQSTLIDNWLLRERLLALLSGFFAIVGLLLAAVGLYGVLSYSVVQRTKEIGIRLALGAQQLAVVRSVVTDASITMLIGAAGGLAGGLYLARFVRAFLYEVQPFDLWSLALPVGLLVCAGALAAVLPARRAARVDPVVALRYE